MTTLRDDICTATDILDDTRRAYYQQRATYAHLTAAARALLELRQQAELSFGGKVKTKINAVTIARLLRSA